MRPESDCYSVPRHLLADLRHPLAPDGLVKVDDLLCDVLVFADPEEYRGAADHYGDSLTGEALDLIYSERDSNVWRWAVIQVCVRWHNPQVDVDLSGRSSIIGACSYASGENYVRTAGQCIPQIAGGGVDTWAPFRSQLTEAIEDFREKLSILRKAIRAR